MWKLWEDSKFGLGLGMGLIVAYGLLKLILMIVSVLVSGVGRGPALP